MMCRLSHWLPALVVGTLHALSAAGAEVKGEAEATGGVAVDSLVAGQWNPAIAKRQASGATNGTTPALECRLRFKTSVWEGCADVLRTFKISLDEFRRANPALGPNCVGFKPGERYCVRQGVRRCVDPADPCTPKPCQGSACPPSSPIPSPTQTTRPISTDGTCAYNKKFVCTGSTFGNCCSAAGYCGRTIYHCSTLLGCQADFGSCGGGDIPPSITSPPPTTVSGSTTTRGSSSSPRPVTTTTPQSSTAATSAPSPTQPNSIPGRCNKFAQAKAGDFCFKFAADNGITTDQLYAWNVVLGAGGSGCSTNFWAGYYYCVGVS